MYSILCSIEVKRFVKWLLFAVVLVCIDQLTKQLIVRTVGPFDVKQVLPFFAIVFTMNPGAAFSLLADASGWQRWFFSIIAIIAVALLLVMLYRSTKDRFLSFGFVLILSGALGNLIDRIMLGAVVDFILIHWRDFRWPVFNVADSCISIGVGILLFDGFFRKRGEARQTLP
ncbi:MAG: signal peptidase II [Proteobacteria bacterium]|nr:signal peptidase II [Pseudomonadota bacterium]